MTLLIRWRPAGVTVALGTVLLAVSAGVLTAAPDARGQVRAAPALAPSPSSTDPTPSDSGPAPSFDPGTDPRSDSGADPSSDPGTDPAAGGPPSTADAGSDSTTAPADSTPTPDAGQDPTSPLGPVVPGPEQSGAPGSGPVPPPLPNGIVLRDGRAHLTRSAPAVIRLALQAANHLQNKPYRYGGGHARFNDRAYDCSGAVSYVLHAAGLLPAPLDSRGLAHWGQPGPGRWITIYANRGHAFMFIAGLRLDTSGAGASGPRWRTDQRSLRAFRMRHPPGL